MDIDTNEQHQTLLNGLVSNAFLRFMYSVEDVESRPTDSISNLAIAIELFLKAKLFDIRWELIFEEKKDADLSKLESGHFRSVGVPEAIKRLRNENIRIPSGIRKCFDKIRSHRNHLVHFFHPSLHSPGHSTTARIVGEQFQAWHRLHQLLTRDWKSTFRGFQYLINEVNAAMRVHAKYLKFKFDAVQPDIKARLKAGASIFTCSSCAQPSLTEEAIARSIVNRHCLTCDYQDRYLSVECPECDTRLSIFEPDTACTKCNTIMDNYILIDATKRFQRQRDSLITPAIGHCLDCGAGDETAVDTGNFWLCVNCFEVFDAAHECEFCSQVVMGETDTYLTGCGLCEGIIGYHKND